MLIIICLWWIGIQLYAPTWYYALLGICAAVKILSYGIDMYKKGEKSEE